MLRKAIIAVLCVMAASMAGLSLGSWWAFGPYRDRVLRYDYYHVIKRPHWINYVFPASITILRVRLIPVGPWVHTHHVFLPPELASTLLAAYPTFAFFRGPLRRRRRRRKGLCVECGYDLTGNESGVCPECGKPI